MAWVECPAFDPRRVTRAPEGEFSLGLGNLLGECNHGLFLSSRGGAYSNATAAACQSAWLPQVGQGRPGHCAMIEGGGTALAGDIEPTAAPPGCHHLPRVA
jgi:hypothetical protein